MSPNLPRYKCGASLAGLAAVIAVALTAVSVQATPGSFSLSSVAASCNGSSPQIVLSWTAASRATSYEVFRNSTLLVSGIPAGTLSFTNGDVLPGTSYTYYIRARDASGTKNSSSKSATAPNTCGPPPTVTATAVADAIVKKSSSSNDGSSSTLRTREDPSGSTYRSYVKFDVTGLTGPVVFAKLRLYATAGNSTGILVHTSGTTWVETTINWNNAPAPSEPSQGSSGPLTENAWTEIRLPETLFTGNGTYSFVLIGASTQSGYFGSREHANKPQLLLTAEAGPPPPVHQIAPTVSPAGAGTVAGGGSYAAGATATLTATASTGFEFVNWTVDGSPVSTSAVYAFQVTGAPAIVANFVEQPTGPVPTVLTATIAADAVVRSSSPGSSDGTSSELRTREEPGGSTYRSYIRFDVSGTGGGRPTSATLRLFATAKHSAGITVYATTSGWPEATLKWDNAPPTGNQVGSIGAIAANTWIEIPLTPDLFASDGPYSFVLVGRSSSSAYFGSRESANKPQLILARTGGGGNPPAGPLPWPGDAAVQTADGSNVFGANMSGLASEGSGTTAPGVLWAVRNNVGTLFRLLWNGSLWSPDASNGWSAGKALRYPGGSGNPDAEGVTVTGAGVSGGVYVVTERNNSADTISRNSILRFVATGSSSTLVATHEWNLTPSLPAVEPNAGLEAIAWVPDAFLVENGFADQSKGPTSPYIPSDYPNHGDGLFFVALEANGTIYAYALNHASSTYSLVATIASTLPGVMDLHFDRELQNLWATCDNGCSGRSVVMRISIGTGTFSVTRIFERPSGMPNLNNEGFTIAPLAECVGDRRPVFWADDGATGGHAIRGGTVTCAPF